jgi:hypothetical protein
MAISVYHFSQGCPNDIVDTGLRDRFLTGLCDTWDKLSETNVS